VLTVEQGPDFERGGSAGFEDGLFIHRMGARLPFRAPFNPLAYRHLERLFDLTEPDVIHVHAGTLSPFAYTAARVGIGRGIPVATTWHSMLDHAYPVLRPWTAATGWIGAPIAWSAVSEVAAEQVARIFQAPVEILHNGIDLDGWTPPEDRPDVGPPLRCVATMRFVPSKRIGALIDIFASATSELPEGSIRLDLFGGGPEELWVRRRIHRQGLDDVVTLNGRARRDELRQIYRSADVFCSPATREAFGIAVLEARTAGLVVVGRSGTGIEEFISNGEDGILTATDAEMARELVMLASDPHYLRNLSSVARSTVPPFGIDRVLNAAFQEYDRARTVMTVGALSSF
jgi:glycosyltransferase involved in cell wall biosynthesis